MEHPKLFVTKEECEAHRQGIQKRLSCGSVDFAVIKTKLNLILGVMGALGTAVAGLLVKMVLG